MKTVKTVLQAAFVTLLVVLSTLFILATAVMNDQVGKTSIWAKP